MITSDEPTVMEETATTCFICHKDLAGKLVKTSKLIALMDPLVAKKIATVGVICDHCDTRYCETHQKELNNTLWQRFTKSTCLKCGQIIGGSRTIVQLQTAREYNEVPELTQVLDEMKLELENTGKVEAKPDGTSPQPTYPLDACPVCGGKKISTTKIPTGSIKDRWFELVLGLLIVLGVAVAVRSGGVQELSAPVSALFQLGGYWVGFEMLWEGLTNHSLPFVGIRLFSSKYDTRATCEECKFNWQVSKEAKA
jgi:hypothetical protein